MTHAIKKKSGGLAALTGDGELETLEAMKGVDLDDFIENLKEHQQNEPVDTMA